MDDGGLLSYNKDYVRKDLVFNTQGFTFNEAKILSENLNNACHLNTWIKQNKKGCNCDIWNLESGKQYSKIKSIIFPYIIDNI